MEFNIEIRKKQLENLDQFISSSRDQVESILEYLGWDSRKIAENQKEMIMCRVNSSHRIPASSAVAHMQTCAWRKEQYTDEDKPLSEPNHLPGSTIIMDNMMKVNILNSALVKNPQMMTGWRSHEPAPRTSDRLFSSFTSDERLALYDYAVASTKGPPEVPEFNISKPKQPHRDMTQEELRAMERDAKRRRIKYKSKCVHTNKKNPTEILRELIETQMEEYEEWLRQDTDEEAHNHHEPPHRPATPPSPTSQTSYRSRDSRHLNNHRRSLSMERSYEEPVRSDGMDFPADRLSKERDILLDRSRHLSNERHHSPDRAREKARDVRRPRSPETPMPRERSRERTCERSRERSRERERTRERSRERSRDRSWGRSRERSRDRSRERPRHRSRERHRDRSRSRDRRHEYRHDSSRVKSKDEHRSTSRRGFHDRRSNPYRHRSREFSSGSSHSRHRDRHAR